MHLCISLSTGINADLHKNELFIAEEKNILGMSLASLTIHDFYTTATLLLYISPLSGNLSDAFHCRL